MELLTLSICFRNFHQFLKKSNLSVRGFVWRVFIELLSSVEREPRVMRMDSQNTVIGKRNGSRPSESFNLFCMLQKKKVYFA